MIYFLWDNFGPLHADRIDAVARAGFPVTGVELYDRSGTYDWVPETVEGVEKITLFSKVRPNKWQLMRALIKFRRRYGKGVWFLCHYERPEIWLFALWLRLRGDRIFTMGCSKFDDIQRSPWREALKTIFLRPYQGAIGSGTRSRDYFRFMGIPADRVVGEYNAVSHDRIRRLSGQPPAPDGLPHRERHFTIVARLIPKKNLVVALRAYAIYSRTTSQPRPLHVCGNGPLEEELKAIADQLEIAHLVSFRGFVQTNDIARILGSTLSLLLPSIEEQFGNVIPEAQAMGLPVILSNNCGARDLLVQSGVNGFVIEPDNPEGLAFFMQLLAEDEGLWRRMCDATHMNATKGDVGAFVEGVKALVEKNV